MVYSCYPFSFVNAKIFCNENTFGSILDDSFSLCFCHSLIAGAMINVLPARYPFEIFCHIIFLILVYVVDLRFIFRVWYECLCDKTVYFLRYLLSTST